MSIEMNRRNFITGAVATGAVAALGLAGCASKASEETAAPAGNAAGSAANGAGAADASAASSNPAWLGEPPAITDADCTETVETEVLVCGAGDSGLFCACAAAEEGAKVLLVDPMEKGFGIRCSALGAVDS